MRTPRPILTQEANASISQARRDTHTLAGRYNMVAIATHFTCFCPSLFYTSLPACSQSPIDYLSFY